MSKIIKKDTPAELKFGGGIHSRASEEDIHPFECANGQNFALDLDNMQFRPRKSFDLIGTLPNAGQVRGGASLLKTDGTVSILFQGNDTVYSWDGISTFTSVGTVDSNAKIRGRLESNWQLDDIVLITDLNLADSVKKWDGTTFSNAAFTDETLASFGTFKARYCYVTKERAIFSNVESNGTATPHLIIGSKRSDYTNITVANRPSSSLSDLDPWFLIQPDNRYINGMVESFGKTVISSQQGSMYQLTGSSAKDFAMDEFGVRMNAAGDESISAMGNDIIFGRQGRIESVSDTDRSGDTELNDLSWWISDQIENEGDWLLAANSRLQRAYFHPVGGSKIWVFHKPVFDIGRLREMTGSKAEALSPWSKWVTAHEMTFNPTFMMPMLDPVDGLEYVFMGDSSGNIYRLEGTGEGDGGSASIETFRLSGLMSAQYGGKMFDLEGYARYRRANAISLVMNYEFAGEHVFNETITLTTQGQTFDAVYGTTAYYGTQYFYGTDEEKLIRQRFAVPGSSNDFQLRTTVDSTQDWTINEIGLRFTQATP